MDTNSYPLATLFFTTEVPYTPNSHIMSVTLLQEVCSHSTSLVALILTEVEKLCYSLTPPPKVRNFCKTRTDFKSNWQRIVQKLKSDRKMGGKLKDREVGKGQKEAGREDKTVS